MKRLNLKSFVKHLSMAALGAVLTAGIVIAPQLSVRADSAVTTDVEYSTSDKSLTISGTIVNDPDFKYGIVLPDGINKKAVEHIIINTSATFPVNASGLFEGFDNVTSIFIQSDSSKTSSMTNMAYMFNGLKKLERIGLTGIDTSNVTNMAGMFLNCQSLESLDLSCFTVSQIKDSGTGQTATDNMISMFENCSKLEKIIVNPNTWSIDSSVIGTYMFSGDVSLVGGNGTLYNSAYVTASYACVDTPETPGYLSTSSSSGLTPYAQLMTDGNDFVLSISIKNESYNTKTYTVYYDNKEIHTDTLMHDETASFNISCVAKEMADVKNLRITDSGTVVFNKNISVADYLRRLCQIYKSDTKVYQMAGSMLRYGAAAQKYFNYNTGNLANKGIDGFTDYTNNISSFPENFDASFDPANMNKALSDDGYTGEKAVTYSAMNLSFDEDLTFMMAFKVPSNSSAEYVNDSKLSALIKDKHQPDDANYSLTTGGPSYIVTMTQNINVKNLDQAVFSSADFGMNVTPVLYLYRVYNKSTNENMRNLAIALYDFHKRAQTYPN